MLWIDYSSQFKIDKPYWIYDRLTFKLAAPNVKLIVEYS